METQAYWSQNTNPQTGKKFEAFLRYIHVAHNGGMDVAGFLASDYGAEFTRRLQTRFLYEDDAMGEKALAWYASMGLKKELFDPENYYERWALLTPLEITREAPTGKRYPLVFSHHGGGSSIETEEFSSGYNLIAGKEKFMVAYLQNTNWQNLQRIFAILCAQYPVDPERVYLSGFSQGGYQTHSAYFRVPELFAAVAPCGNDIYRAWDNFDLPYTEEEKEHLRRVFVPFFQMTSVTEASSFVPLTDWRPRKNWNDVGDPETFHDPRKNDDEDPTRMHDPARGFRDPARLRSRQGHTWSQCTPPTPPPDTNKHLWMMSRINTRMELLGCPPRAPSICLGYAAAPQDELHHTLGIYADREAIQTFYGYKHYIADIWNADGINAFRYIAVENCPHWPYLMMGELAWQFFKQFRRDSRTGKIQQATTQNRTEEP